MFTDNTVIGRVFISSTTTTAVHDVTVREQQMRMQHDATRRNAIPMPAR